LVQAEHSWVEYLKGVAWALRERHLDVHGWEGVLGGDVPRGAGLSSSAALELATLRAFAALAGAPWHPGEAAVIGQRVENRWIGVNSGIMDQMVVASAQEHHALLLDCRSLQVRHVPIPDTIAVVVMDTATRRGLVDSAYNERRRQCEAAAAHCGVSALRDLTSEQLETARPALDDTAYRRARHVVTENARTLAAADALRSGDLHALGQLMNASHASLRDDFEVTNRELDVIVGLAQAEAACFGARMTGAGFGGCAVAIVERDAAERFIESVSAGYQSATGLQPAAYICRAAGGVSLETEPSTESVRS
jgi:galactokinase